MTGLSRKLGLVAAAMLAAAGLGGCAQHMPLAELPRPGVVQSDISVDADTGMASTTITVVTYNVAGLPWPVRSGTGRAMRRIDAAFAEAFSPRRPDLLLLQEAFVPSATRLPANAGFANIVRGPGQRLRSTLPVEAAEPAFRQGRRRFRGERSGRIVNAGLLVASDHHLQSIVREPFGRHSCAGFDCLANKGMMLVEVHVPGLPEPLFIFNTHMNSRTASGVPHERSRIAHHRQVEEMALLLARDWRGRGPLIYAGDFNTRQSPDRFTYKDERLPGELAHRYCMMQPNRCDVRMSWDSDEPWLDTQDLQGFANGPLVTVEPIVMAAMFDAPINGVMLSDHDALLVTYRLSWRMR